MSMVSGSAVPYIAPDQILVDQIVYELKSQGIFDSFRKECIADVDTKPAYQNLRQRVEGSVSSFLKEQRWKPESNKNQLREMLRKNIYESGFLETGVERIVNQVVNPKINTVFLPKVKEVFYKYIGLQTIPVTTEENSFVDTQVKIEDEPITQNLLPTDLDTISPENEKVDIEATEDSNSMAIDDDDTSPPFEPIDEDLSFKLIPIEDSSIDSHLSGISGQNSEQNKKDTTVAMQHLLESDSQLSKNSSSDDRLSIVTDEASNTKVDIVEESKNDKLTDLPPVGEEVAQESKDNIKLADELVAEDLKASEDLQIKDQIVEDSKIILSTEISTIKLDSADGILKHKKDASKDHKKDSSKHYKSRDKSKDTKDSRESKSKSLNSKSSKDKHKDSKSTSKSSSASTKHSSDKDKDNKRHSSSSTKDKNNSSSSKDKTSSSKDKTIAPSGGKDSVSSRHKESSKDHSSGTSSDRDKSSKDHSKDGKSKSTTPKTEHRSSSVRKYSTSHSDASKSQISSSTNKDKREKTMKDDHFSSKTQLTGRRSTDRDSNDGQTKNKDGSGGTRLVLKSEEHKSSNTTEDSSSNSKDSCQTEAKIESSDKQVKENLQIIAVEDLQNHTEVTPVENDLLSDICEVAKSNNVPDLVETLDAIKSHLAEYKVGDHKLTTIKLPKVASNFREARKIMKLRKQLKKHGKLIKLIVKGNIKSEECPIKESSEILNAVVHVENKDDSSLALLEQDLSNDAASNQIVENTENGDIKNEIIETNSNDDCLYLDTISEKTTRYINYTTSFIETLNKEISAPRINKKRKTLKRKISTISPTIPNNPEQNAPNLKAQNSNSTSDSKADAAPTPSGADTAGVTSATAHVHVVKQRRINNSKATQRYTSDDLYKPRPFLKGTTKRTSGRVAN